MPGYSTLNPFSRVQLQSEDRKQRAHLKKISEMQRRSGLDNGAPLRFPHVQQNYMKISNEKRREINKENDVKLDKLLLIMTAKPKIPLPPFHPTNQIRRSQTIRLSRSNTEYLARIAKAKGKYDAREWKKGYEQHKEYLRISKDNKVFTPLDIGVSRERILKTNSLMNSKRTTPTSSTNNMFQKSDKTND